MTQHEHDFGHLQRKRFCKHCFATHKELLFVDRIYHDTYASLGLGVLNSAPVAFLPYEDRPHHFDLTKHIPQAIPLSLVGRALFQRDNSGTLRE